MSFKILLLFFTILISTNISSCEKIRYDGYKVLRMYPITRQQIDLLPELEKLGAIFVEEPTLANSYVDVLFPPHLQGDLFSHVKSFSGMRVEETISDLQTVIDSERVSDSKAWTGWTEYQTFDAYMEFLHQKAAQFPDVAQVIQIGNSYEGRPLNVIRLQKDFTTPRPAIWIDSNIHAREWISGAVVTYFIEQLLNSTSSIHSWLDEFDFFIMPIANPDGFSYTRTNRLWRKTRSRTDSILGCRGADPNRNFGYKWLTGGSSNVPCDDTYAGPSAFSEIETKTISDFYNLIAGDVKCFISIHSYSQFVIFPYGLADEQLTAPEYAKYMEIGNKVKDALGTRYGTAFRVGSITDILYPASGGSIDWVKAVHDTYLTFAFELRDTGAYGFLLPAEQIVPSAEEFIDGFGEFIAELRTAFPN